MRFLQDPSWTYIQGIYVQVLITANKLNDNKLVSFLQNILKHSKFIVFMLLCTEFCLKRSIGSSWNSPKITYKNQHSQISLGYKIKKMQFSISHKQIKLTSLTPILAFAEVSINEQLLNCRAEKGTGKKKMIRGIVCIRSGIIPYNLYDISLNWS